MQADPLISVIIPVYNGPDALKRAVASVLDQTYRNFELIIVDDCSSDPVEEAVSSFTDGRIMYLRHDENKGVSAARNTGMRQASGSFWAFLDSDDEMFSSRLELQLKVFLDLGPDIGLMLSNLGSFDGEDQTYVPGDIPSGRVTCSRFPGSIFVPPSSWMLRRDVAGRVGFFDEQLITAEDADYFVRVLEQAQIYYLRKILGRKHLSFERKGYFLPRHFTGNDRFLEKHLDRMKKDPAYLSRFYYNKAKDLARSERRHEARAYFFKAFFLRPCIRYFVKYLRG